MVYVTGDTHGDIDISKISNASLKKQNINIKEEDFLIILGDFGFPFLDTDREKSKTYQYWIKWLKSRPYTVLWIDGNHDNFNFWRKQPITEWNGGKVQIHPDASNVIHLMRGEVYEIEGRSYFTFGGAASTDKKFRKPNVTWWEQETASSADIENAHSNLEKCNFEVDYILTHTPPASLVAMLPSCFYSKDDTAEFLSTLVYNVSHNAWLSGHLHMDVMFPQHKTALLYKDVKSIDEIERTLF